MEKSLISSSETNVLHEISLASLTNSFPKGESFRTGFPKSLRIVVIIVCFVLGCKDVYSIVSATSSETFVMEMLSSLDKMNVLDGGRYST